MTTLMHFRKRQLLQYQKEVNSYQPNNRQQIPINDSSYTYINEHHVSIEYPPSPSSMASDKSTPRKIENNVTTSEQMQNLARNTAALLEMQNLSLSSCQDAHKLSQITDALIAIENSSCSANVPFFSNGRHFTYDTPTLIQIAYKLKETIEDYINQQTVNSFAPQTSLSTIILAKLNQLKLNALLQTYQSPHEISYIPPFCSLEPELEPEDLSMKHVKQETQFSAEQSDEDYEDDEEPRLVIDESYIEKDNDDYISTDAPKYGYQGSRGLDKVFSQISEIFAFMNGTQLKLDGFMTRGIDVYEIVVQAPEISKKKSLKRKISSSPSSTSRSLENNPTKQFKPSTYFNQIPWSNEPKSNLLIFRTPIYPVPSSFDPNLIIIGSNGTTIPKESWSKIDWDLTPPAVTRKILMMLFDREFLSTHSLTGRPSPAFLDLNKPEKKPLDANIVADIVELVTSRTIATAKEVRMAITTKCADESKMRRWREIKQTNDDKENLELRPY